MIDKLFLQTHITALKAIGPHWLLEGSGGFLNLYDVKSNQLLESVNLFRGARIHGIRISQSEKLIFVYGGKKVSVLDIQHLPSQSLKVIEEYEEIDWIQDIKLVDNDKYLVMLTSHNHVCIWDARRQCKIHQIPCEENCILYSGKILGESLSDVIILSGTVFGEILVWGIRNSQVSLFHRLAGHKGVIFSINFDRKNEVLISTSDDRSVRIWAIHRKTDVYPENLWDLFSDAEISHQHELYGHEARVWNSLVVRQSPDDQGRIASLGEDSRICLWNMVSGELLTQIDAHQGSSVWAADWIPSLNTLASGGGDGSIRLWSASSHFLEPVSKHLDLTPVMESASDVPRLAATIAETHWIVTHHGGIYCWQNQNWAKVYQNSQLRNGCVMDTDPSTSSMVLGTLCGSVFIFTCYQGRIEQRNHLKVDSSKIFSIRWVDPSRFMVCLNEGRMQLWNCHSESFIMELLLPPAKQRWAACALTVGNIVLIGDREGSFYLYPAYGQSPATALRSFPHVHGKNGVTDIQLDPTDSSRIYTSGKDGQVRLWHLDGSPDIELVCVMNTGLGWIARLLWIQQELIYLAFHSDQFVVWSAAQQRALMSVTCGGGHRSWSFCIDQSAERQVSYLYVKDKQVHEYHRTLNSIINTSIKLGGHSRSTCAAKLIRLPNGTTATTVIFTGSEDTTLRLSSLTKNNSLKCLTIVTKHVSSIRALAAKEIDGPDDSAGSTRKWICVSAGGRAQLCVGLVRFSACDGDEHVIYSDVRTHFLRGFLNRRTSNKPWASGTDTQLVPDTETRYMDVAVIQRQSDAFHIIAACSDGFIRVFDCCLESRRLEVSSELNFHRCCVLKVSVTHHPISGRAILLSTGTKGRLVLWDISELSEETELRPLAYWTIHQSGINSLHWQWIDNNLLVLTGGDDNALIRTEIRLDAALTGASIVEQQKQIHAHAAQISGVSFIDRHMAVSVSLDQRLILWRVQSLERIDGICCDVSDIQGLDVTGISDYESLVCVYGQGVQLLRIRKDQ